MSYEGSVREHLISEAVAVASLEIEKERFGAAKKKKDALDRKLTHVQNSFHNFIGHYGILVGSCPEAREYVETVARAGEGLQHDVQEAHLNAVRLLQDKQRQERPPVHDYVGDSAEGH